MQAVKEAKVQDFAILFYIYMCTVDSMQTGYSLVRVTLDGWEAIYDLLPVFKENREKPSEMMIFLHLCCNVYITPVLQTATVLVAMASRKNNGS